MNEIRLAFLRLAKHPAATIASIATLACAIGAAAATWSLLSAVLLRPLPVEDPDHLFVVGMPVTTGRAAGTLLTGFVYPYYVHVRDSGAFERVAAVWHPAMRLLVDPGAGHANAYVSFVTHDYFDVLGVRLQSGRPLSSDDDREGAAPVAIVSDGYWRRTLQSRPDIVGRTLVINHRPATVVGIAAPGFRGVDLAESPDLFMPFHVIADVAGPPMNFFARPNTSMSPTAGVMLVGRSPLPRSQVDARLAVVAPVSPGSSTVRLVASPANVEAVPQMTRAGVTQFARILGATVVLLLVAGCLTVGTLLLVRTEARQDEFAMCLALGASRARLARGVAIEGALLASLGAALALPASLAMFQAVRAYQLPGGVSIESLDLALDLRVVAAAAAGSLAAMGSITVVAAWLGFRADVADAIRSRLASTRLVHRRPRTFLVAGQVAVALTLVAGAGVFTRTLAAALSLNAGFEPARLVTGTLSLRQYEYDPTRATEFLERLKARLDGHPSVASLTFFEDTGGMSGRLAIDGVPRQFPTQVDFVSVDQRYFSTVGMPLLSGRDFSPSDGPRAPLVGIVSGSYARLLREGSSALGTRITMPFSRTGQPPQVEIVGVVPDVISRVTAVEPLVLYRPRAQQDASTYVQWIVRARADPAVTMRAISATIREIDGTIVPPAQSTLQEAMARQMNAQKFAAVVLGALGGIAVLLALLGTYVLAESMAVMRTREMGVRAALGATRRQLATLMLRETAQLVMLGLGVGLFLAWAGAGTIQSFMFQVQPLDPLTLAAVSTAILILALTVTLRPALRASHLDLAAVLRAE